MIKILFVCHGNICRSPMAEFCLKDMVRKAGLSGEFEIASAATSSEELGNPVYPPGAFFQVDDRTAVYNNLLSKKWTMFRTEVEKREV